MAQITEDSSLYDNLEDQSVHELLLGIHEEDKKVLPAVERAVPQIEKLVLALVERMLKGGRLFYIGVITSYSIHYTKLYEVKMNSRARWEEIEIQVLLRRFLFRNEEKSGCR